MVKIISLLALFGIYFSAFGQKPSYYLAPETDLNQFQFFYMPNSTIDTHELTNPFFNKSTINDSNYKYFVLYNELSLKNLTILDGHGGDKTLEVYIYEGGAFENRAAPIGYHAKKIKGKFLIIDFLNSTNHQLVWRGWMDLKKLKQSTQNGKIQKAISIILLSMKIEPIITE